MITVRKLRLGPLPKTESVKVTFQGWTGLKADLDRYAPLHARTYGEAVDATTLIRTCLKRSWRGIADSGGAAEAATNRLPVATPKG